MGILTAREFKARQDWVKKHLMYVAVPAVDAMQGGSNSAEVASPPDAPVLSIDSYPTSTSVTISWTEVTGATLYTIYVDGEFWDTSVNNNPYDVGLAFGVDTDIYVTATGAGGESDPSNTVTANSIGFYPTVANSLVWIDRFRSATDASGLVLAGDGDSVRTISLPTDWGASLGDGLVVQATGANRPTYRTAGLQGNGTSTRMTLPSALSLSGAFTAWVVVDFNGTAAPTVYGLAGNAGTYGGVLVDRFVDSLRCYSDDASSYIRDEPLVTTGKVLVRIRRTAANAMYFAATGLAEVAKSSTTYTWAIDRIFARGGGASDWTNSGVRFCQWVVVGDDAVTAGTSAAVEEKLLALEGVSL